MRNSYFKKGFLHKPALNLISLVVDQFGNPKSRDMHGRTWFPKPAIQGKAEMKKRLTLYLLFGAGISLAQTIPTGQGDPAIDSLKQLLATERKDTTRFHLMLNITDPYSLVNFDSAIAFEMRADLYALA
jgi:hypothetical protein